ncbi:hypothetical protein RHSIM_Rhsim13G0081100 [Rhododendron simsii]|uniref:Uncharacterized protein n=1 Tax=Rhododendron simsii TaxID=118357 RepID=A0A834FZ36_RHOSS|nr:hypothetical protein RHSIM_Rhsim13G0081100 [Rhododendron simsii]
MAVMFAAVGKECIHVSSSHFLPLMRETPHLQIPLHHNSSGLSPASFLEFLSNIKVSQSAASAAGIMPVLASKRDYSLVLQHDGIHGAFCHCKRSYNSTRDYGCRRS